MDRVGCLTSHARNALCILNGFELTMVQAIIKQAVSLTRNNELAATPPSLLHSALRIPAPMLHLHSLFCITVGGRASL